MTKKCSSMRTPEPQLAAELGLSRSSMREAVKALEQARILDVRRGDGTYVTSLEPRLLLEGLGFAVELIQDDTLMEVVEVRRLLEPPATALAARRITPAQLAELDRHLTQMHRFAEDQDNLIRGDLAFHQTVANASGNQTLASILEGLSTRTLRARAWRGVVVANASHATIAEHEAITRALRAGDPDLAFAAALTHVATSEDWMRSCLREHRRPAPHPEPDES